MKKKVTRLELAQEFYEQEVENNLGIRILLAFQPILKWWFYYSAGAVLVNFLFQERLPEWLYPSAFSWGIVSVTLFLLVWPFYVKNADRLRDPD